MRHCLYCEHFYYSSGSPAYSEYTPGSDIVIECSQNVWEVDPYMTNEREFIECMKRANTCDMYEARDKEV